jgi:hypothetical protein
MSGVRFLEPLIQQQIDGTAYTTQTTPGSILAPAAKFTLPANFMEIGRHLKVRASGRMSTQATPGTLTFDVRFGSVVVLNGGASGTLNASQTNVSWRLEADLICRSIGASTVATMYGSMIVASLGLSASLPVAVFPATSPGVGTGFDSTVAAVVDLFVTWSAASNSIRCDDYSLLAVN